MIERHQNRSNSNLRRHRRAIDLFGQAWAGLLRLGNSLTRGLWLARAVIALDRADARRRGII